MDSLMSLGREIEELLERTPLAFPSLWEKLLSRQALLEHIGSTPEEGKAALMEQDRRLLKACRSLHESLENRLTEHRRRRVKSSNEFSRYFDGRC